MNSLIGGGVPTQGNIAFCKILYKVTLTKNSTSDIKIENVIFRRLKILKNDSWVYLRANKLKNDIFNQ